MATEKDFKVKNGLQVGNGLINATSGDVSLRRQGSTTNRIRITSGNIINDTNVIISGNLDVSGNFNITGDINQTSVTTLDVTDKTITVANNAGSAANANNAGLIVDTGGTLPSLLYTSAGDNWNFNKDLSIAGVADAKLEITSNSGGDPTIVFNALQANRSAIFQYLDNGSNVGGYYKYSHAADEHQFGSATATNINLKIGDFKTTVFSANSSSSDWGNRGLVSSVQINAANRTFSGLVMDDTGSGDGAAIGFRYDGTGYKLELATAPSSGGALSTHLTIDRLGAITTSGHLDVGNELTVLGTTILKNSGVVTIKAAPLGSTYGAGFNAITVTGTSSSPYTSTIGFSNYGETNAMVIKGANVGIGETDPDSKLHVKDATNISASAAGAGQFRVEGSGYTTSIAMDATRAHIYHNSSLRNLSFGTDESIDMTIKGSNGNVGINNSDPDQKLSVNGVISSDENQDFYGAWMQGNSSSNGYSTVAVGEWYSSGLYLQKKTGEAFSHIYSYAPTYPIAIAAGSGSHGETALTNGQGKVGIGTTGPTAKLHVVDNDSDDYIAIFKQTHTSNLGTVNIDTPTDNNSRPSRLDFSRGGTLRWKTGMVYGDTSNGWGLSDATGSGTAVQQTRFLVQPGGNVGIGTTSPNAGSSGTQHSVLTVKGSGSLGNGILELIQEGTTGNNQTLGDIKFFDNTNHNVSIEALRATSTDSGTLEFKTRAASGSLTKRMSIDSDGNVGIGNASPDYQLHVAGAGDIKIEDTGGGSAHLHMGSSTSGLRNSEWRLKTSGSADEFYIDHTYTANNGSSDVAGSGTVLTLKSDANVDVTNDIVTNNAKLKALNISKTMDTSSSPRVFVYDTSKDSDGGAWRHRTQHTSWYNETLNTATRGSRKEFPAVAIMVTDNSKVTIYDGDDPDMPMWMVWNAGTSATDETLLRFGSPGTVRALNGIMIVTLTNHYGPSVHNFISEESTIYRTNGIHKFLDRDPGFAARNVLTNEPDNLGTRYIAGDYVVGSAMKVLSKNAPIDSKTGLPIPTIVFASTGGLSVIRPEDISADLNLPQIYSITAGAGSSYNGASYVDIIDDGQDGYLIFEQDSAGRAQFYIPIPDFANRTTQTSDGSITDKVVMKFYSGAYKTNIYPYYSGAGISEGIALKGKKHLLRATGGQVTLVDPNVGSPEVGKVAYIGSDYNTGWHISQTKISIFNETKTGNISSASNMITNGDFSNGTTGWSTGTGASISVSGGQATITSSSSIAWNGAYQALTGLTVGQKYIITADLISSNNWGSFSVTPGPGNANRIGIYSSWSPNSQNGTKVKVEFIATASTLYLSIDNLNTTNATVTVIDNIDMRIAINNIWAGSFGYQDQVVGLQAIGNFNHTPVSTGAELQSYSRNATSAYYFEHPDVDPPGTRDFCVYFWIKPNSVATSGYGHVLSFGTNTTSGQSSATGFTLKFATNTGLNSAGIIPYFYSGTGGDKGTYDTSKVFKKGHWQFVVAGRKNNTAFIYVNGKILNTGTSGAFNSNITDTFCRVMAGHGVEYSGDVEYAMLRYATMFPGEECINDMYNDEKRLFTPNSNISLYGTSSSANALAYDSTTDSYHIGTSSGRSEFLGLARIDNTTDSISASISASNNLVADR